MSRIYLPKEIQGHANPSVKPTGPLEIDWSHPMAQGLEGCWTLSEATPRELVHGEPATVVGTSNVFPRKEKEGLAWEFDGTALTWLEHPDADYWSFLNLQPFSVFAIANLNTIGSFGAGLLSKWATAGPHLGEWTFNVSGADKLLFQCLESGTSDRISMQSTEVLSTGRTYALGASYNGGTVDESISLYIDGQPAPGAGFGNDSAYGGMINSTAKVTVGASLYGVGASQNRTLDGTLWCVYLFRRELSAADHLSLFKSPYQFLKPKYDISYVTADVAAGGYVIYEQYYRHLLAGKSHV